MIHTGLHQDPPSDSGHLDVKFEQGHVYSCGSDDLTWIIYANIGPIKVIEIGHAF